MSRAGVVVGKGSKSESVVVGHLEVRRGAVSKARQAGSEAGRGI